MADKLVTHKDLERLRDLRAVWGEPEGDELLDRLIAAAEADEPPLPNGWVHVADEDGYSKVLWHRDGRYSIWSDGTAPSGIDPSHEVTPVRVCSIEGDQK